MSQKKEKMYVHGHKQINCVFVIIYKLIIWLIISSFKWNLIISLSDGHSKNRWEITPKTTERDKEKLIENVSGWVLLQLVKPQRNCSFRLSSLQMAEIFYCLPAGLMGLYTAWMVSYCNSLKRHYCKRKLYLLINTYNSNPLWNCYCLLLSH